MGTQLTQKLAWVGLDHTIIPRKVQLWTWRGDAVGFAVSPVSVEKPWQWWREDSESLSVAQRCLIEEEERRKTAGSGLPIKMSLDFVIVARRLKEINSKSLVDVEATCDLRPRQLCKKLFHKQAHAVSERVWLEPHYYYYHRSLSCHQNFAMALSSNDLKYQMMYVNVFHVGVWKILFKLFSYRKTLWKWR